MTPIPQAVLDRGWKALVHVEGWDARFIFHHVRTDPDGTHHLITPRSRRAYTTRNPLCYTKRYGNQHQDPTAMQNKIPDGDPVLDLDAREYATWQAFAHAWAERNGTLPSLSDTEQALTASLMLFLRKRGVETPDFTGHTITWHTADGRVCVADCLKQVAELCYTDLGLVHYGWVSLFEQDAMAHINWPPARKLTGVC